jgi:hypothetical protein
MKAVCSVLLLHIASFIATEAFISSAHIHNARLPAVSATRSKTAKAPIAPQVDPVDILAFGLTAAEFEAAKAAFSSTLNIVQPQLDSNFVDSLSASSGDKLVTEHSADDSRYPRCLLVLNRSVKVAALAAARAALDDSIEQIVLVKPTVATMKQWKSKRLQMSEVWSAAVAHHLQENELVVPVDTAACSFDPSTVRNSS